MTACCSRSWHCCAFATTTVVRRSSQTDAAPSGIRFTNHHRAASRGRDGGADERRAVPIAVFSLLRIGGEPKPAYDVWPYPPVKVYDPYGDLERAGKPGPFYRCDPRRNRMTEGKHRVVVWSTGGIGSIAIRAIHQRPNLDLVGVWVHSPEKDGMDAGELANGEPDRAGRHHRCRRADRAQTRLRRLRGQRPRARRAGDPRLREVAQRRNQRGDDKHHTAGQSACLRTGRVARPTRRGGQGGPGLAVRVGHRARLRRRLPAACADHAVVVRSRRSMHTRSGCTTTTVCPTS